MYMHVTSNNAPPPLMLMEVTPTFSNLAYGMHLTCHHSHVYINTKP